MCFLKQCCSPRSHLHLNAFFILYIDILSPLTLTALTQEATRQVDPLFQSGPSYLMLFEPNPALHFTPIVPETNASVKQALSFKV